jgi:putative ABC transport system substrate-binding protein
VKNTISRRELVSQLTAATAVAALGVPSAGLAQAPSGKPKLVGVMMAIAADDPEGLGRVDLFRRALAEAGWTDGRNVTIEIGWYRGNLQIAHEVARDLIRARRRRDAREWHAGHGGFAGSEGRRPDRLRRRQQPGRCWLRLQPFASRRNITGFSTFEPDISGKWLQLLRQVVPGLKNASMLLDPKFTGFNSLWQAIAEVAPAHGIASTRGAMPAPSTKSSRDFLRLPSGKHQD